MANNIDVGPGLPTPQDDLTATLNHPVAVVGLSNDGMSEGLKKLRIPVEHGPGRITFGE